MERYWVSNDVLLNLSDRLGEALPRDKFTPMVKAADAQATIAALQARVESANKLIYKKNCDLGRAETIVNDLQSQLTQRTAECDALKLVNDTHMKTVMKLSHVVEQRTAELEAARRCKADEHDLWLQACKERDDMQAELERVRGELVEATHNVNVYQSLYSTGCMDRALLENELRDLRTLIAALPKVEGKIEVHTFKSTNQVVVTYNRGIIIGTLYGLDHAKPVAALYEHRQGMEG